MFIQPKTNWNMKKNYCNDNQFEKNICKGSLEIISIYANYELLDWFVLHFSSF